MLLHVPVQQESPGAAFPTGPAPLEEFILVAKAQRGIAAAGTPVNLAQGPGANLHHHDLSFLCPGI